MSSVPFRSFRSSNVFFFTIHGQRTDYVARDPLAVPCVVVLRAASLREAYGGVAFGAKGVLFCGGMPSFRRERRLSKCYLFFDLDSLSGTPFPSKVFLSSSGRCVGTDASVLMCPLLETITNPILPPLPFPHSSPLTPPRVSIPPPHHATTIQNQKITKNQNQPKTKP